MARNPIRAAAAGGFALLAAAYSPAEAAQERVSLQERTFIDRCIEHGALSGGESNYVCTGPVETQSVSCIFGVEETLCSWLDGSDAFARSLIAASPSPGTTPTTGSRSLSDMEAAPRVLLPGFGGYRSGEIQP